MEIKFVEGYREARYKLFLWRYELEWYYKLLFAFSLACFTGLFAQLRFLLPWTPVPITGKTSGVISLANIWKLLMMGAIPFIAGDITKALAAAAVAGAVTPKMAYNGEVDIEKAKKWKIPYFNLSS